MSNTATDATAWIREEACSSDVTTWYPVKEEVWRGQTRFQDVVIADTPSFGRCLFLDNEIQSSAEDEDIYHECLVHPAMSAAKADVALRILVIGGGEGATVREVLKWGDRVGHVTWVDIDGELVNICREHLGWAPPEVYDSPKVAFLPMDIRVFFDSCKDRFDVIIVDLPDPDPAGDDLQDAEFWRHVNWNLAEGGVFVSHVGPVRRRGESGMTYTVRKCAEVGINMTPVRYHIPIASFQDDWGFVLFAKDLPVYPDNDVPSSLRFLTPAAWDTIFRWPY